MTNALTATGLFTQMFTVEILSLAEGAASSPIAPALCTAITGWERELNDEKEEDDSEDPDFMVPDSDDDVGDDDDDDVTDEDDEEGVIVEETSDSTLALVTQVSAAVLADIKALQAMDADERVVVRIVYGERGDTMLVRQFTISPDLGVLLSEGTKETHEPLLLTLIADIYDTETIF